MSRNGLALSYAINRIASSFFNLPAFLSAGDPPRPRSNDAPRRWAYPSIYNLATLPRRDIVGLAAFETLRALCRNHVLASLCIRTRIVQVMGVSGSVVARDPKMQSSEQSTCDEIMDMLARPDGVTPLTSWLAMILRDLLEIDAPTIYKRPARGGGIASWEVVDGSTIKPIIDDYGRIIAYQQVIAGVSLGQYRVSEIEETIVNEFAPGELWYRPYQPSSSSPYGRPPMEDLIMLANVYLQKMNYDLAHFSEGNIPAALGIFDGSTLSVDQVAEFEEHFNTRVAGDVARGAKIHFVPFPLKVERLTQLSNGGQYESAFEERNVRIVCAHYGVTPSEIGFTEGVNRAVAESQENVTYRIGIKPLLEWLKTMLFDPIIQDDLQQQQLEWRWNFGESEDREMLARIHAADIDRGVITPAESRAMRYPDLDALGVQAQSQNEQNEQNDDVAQIAKASNAEDAPPDNDERERFIDALRTLLRAVFREHGDRLLDLFRDARSLDDIRSALTPVWWSDEERRLARRVLPLMDDIALAAAEGGAALIVIGDFGGVNEDVLALARAAAQAWAQHAINTSDKQVAQIIADWIALGGDMPDLIERVTAVAKRWQGERSDVAAITEVTRLFAQGNALAWRRSGIVSSYRIETAADELVCPICRPKRGTVHPLDDDENLPPFHARCRCWIVPVVRPIEENV